MEMTMKRKAYMMENEKNQMNEMKKIQGKLCYTATVSREKKRGGSEGHPVVGGRHGKGR